MPQRSQRLERMARQARGAALRTRTNEVLTRAAAWAILPLVYAAGVLAVVKLGWAGPALERRMLWGGLVPVGALLVAVIHAALHKRAPHSGALALDRHHGLHDRVTNALVFSRTPEGERTPLMEAAIDDAVALAADISARRAVPLRAPRDLGAVVVLGIGIAALALLEVPRLRVLPPPEAKRLEGLALSPDDVELFRHVSDELDASTTDPAAQAGARRFNQIVEDLAERRLDRREVFRRLDELDRSLKDPFGAEGSALDEALDGVAKELEKSAMAKPVAQALQEKRLADAEQALKDLAKKVENAKKDVDKAKLEALRQSLKRAGETISSKAAQTEASRQEAEERRKRLLQKKQKEGLTKPEQQELERTERQLERLDREKRRAEQQQREMSGLDKDLQKAAQDLMKELGTGAKDLEQGAQDLNRAAQNRMSQQQKEELKKRIEEMRQILRQEGQAGRDRLKRMMQFGQRARGSQGQGQGQGRGEGKGQGQGQGEGQGQGKDGKGKEPRLTLGNGQPGAGSGLVMMPGGSAPGPGGEGQDPGGGGPGKGSEWGTGHDANVRGDATKLKGQTEDVTAAGVDTGQGAAASEVIYGAAERGFVGRGYKKVYTDYRNVAEESLTKDEIPPGYRFYVRRYFQLIRPRD